MTDSQPRTEANTLQLTAGGTLNPDHDVYIERPEDSMLLRLLLDHQYANVLTSRQMGKSSLMVKTARVLHQRNVRVAIVDLAGELGSPADSDTYYRGLIVKLTRALGVNADPRRWWAEHGSETNNQRLIGFFREVVLEQVTDPIVVFLDEIDSTLRLAYTDDLFTAIRGMHNERPIFSAYRRLTFCLLGVATPNELIKDRRTTPYNVGRTIELRDFDSVQDDLTPLARVLNSEPEAGRQMVDRVLHWTGGHPYLTTAICADLLERGVRTPDAVDAHVEQEFQTLDAVTANVHIQTVLRFLETRVADGLAVLGLYQRLVRGARERDQPTLAHAELKLSGLVKRDAAGCLVIRNRIYRRLFNRRWVNGAAPTRSLILTRRFAAAASFALLFVLASGGSYYFGGVLPEQRKLEALLSMEEIGIAIFNEENETGNRIRFPEGTDQYTMIRAADLFWAVEPITEVDLTGAPVTDVSPLAGLNNLHTLNLDSTLVTDLSPLGDLANLQSLILARTQVADLSPLDGLPNLQILDLGGTQVADVSPLGGLSNLAKLLLWDTRLADVSPLAGLTELQSLDLSGTHLADVSLLADLAELRSLDLSMTQVADVRPLAGLTELQSLDLSGTQVTDLSPLGGLSNLVHLILIDTQVVDFSSLACLTQLQSLDLSGTQVADLSPLDDLSNLVQLMLWDTQVADVSPLAGLTDLQSLDLAGTQVADVSPLAGLTDLQELSLTGTPVADVNPLGGLSNLVQLMLWDTQVADVSPLAGLTDLQSLNLAGTQVADVRPLAGLTDLQELSLTGTPVADFNPLGGLTDLVRLTLWDTQIVDLGPLAPLTNLSYLDIDGTQVVDISPLAGLTNLETLDARNTSVADVSPLAGLNSLQALYLQNTPLTDVSPLAGLNSLQALYLQNTPLTDVRPLAGLTSLRSLSLSDTQVSPGSVVRLREALAAAGNTRININSSITR